MQLRRALRCTGHPLEKYGVREIRSILLWSLAIPLLALGLGYLVGAPGLLVLAVYPLQVVRLGTAGRRSARENWLQAVFLIIGKFPGLLGLLRFQSGAPLAARRA